VRVKFSPLRSAAICAVLVSGLFAQACPPQGMTLTVDGGRLGDPWSLFLNGPALAAGVLGFDLDGGPVATPVGSICLGLTPNLVLWPIVLGPTGDYALGGYVPADPALSGITIHTQALAATASQPSGFAVSNGGSLTLRPPRILFIASGIASPFGTTPGAVAAVGALTDTVPYGYAFPSSVRDAAFAQRHDALAVLLGNGALAGYDGSTAAPLFNVPLPAAPSNPLKIAVSDDGENVLVVAAGSPPSPFGGGSPGGLHVVSLQTGAVTATIPLLSGNPEALLVLPGTSLVYLRLASAVVVVDLAAAFVHPPIPVTTTAGTLVDWKLDGFLYVLHAGTTPGPFGGGGAAPVISMIDPYAQMFVASTGVGVPAPAKTLRAGPGSTGPSLYVLGTSATIIPEIAQSSLLQTGVIASGTGILAMELSPLGAEWILLCGGAGCGGPALWAMTVGSLLPVTVAPLVGGMQPLIAVSPSSLFGKAYLVQGTNVVAPFFTDPVSPPYATFTLPIAASQLLPLSN
jgi:hypothetical protein